MDIALWFLRQQQNLTLPTVMSYLQSMFRSLNQDWIYVVYNEAMCCKAQTIKWKNTDEFQSDYIEMGGMHRAINFMGDTGHIMQEGRFEDVLVEANVYGASVVSHALHGKAHDRGVRIQKIMYESMRLEWMALADSIKNSDLSQDKQDTILDKGRRCLEIFEDVKKAQRQQKNCSECYFRIHK